jgi:small multidrug resistance family-3 protein
MNDEKDATFGVIINEESTLSEESDGFSWTAITVLQSVALFCVAGFAEVVGGWLVWVAFRGTNGKDRPWWFALLGSMLLVAYGFIPLLQPTDNFGRIYAAYGGFFIMLSFLFGWALDGTRPDIGDIVGGLIALVGVCLVMFWPRG